MAEREAPAIPVWVDYICDKCNTGLMERSGPVLMTSPPQYPHKCNHCADVKRLTKSYPEIRHTRGKTW
jgi:hypothetical protein